MEDVMEEMAVVQSDLASREQKVQAMIDLQTAWYEKIAGMMLAMRMIIAGLPPSDRNRLREALNEMADGTEEDGMERMADMIRDIAQAP
jgi:hypothetical protein